MANCSDVRNVKILPYMCSSKSLTLKVQVSETGGTASMKITEDGNEMEAMTIDKIISQHREISDFNMLKIDTDGHDFEVIAGAKESIEKNMPIILFECDSFSSPTYVEDITTTLILLRNLGYDTFLVYDNFGYLMGKYSLSNLSPFMNLVFYDLISPFYYFDLLLMKGVESFCLSEINYFVDKMPNKTLQRAACVASEIDLHIFS